MNLDEAIRVLETEAHLAQRQPETGIYNAIKLGIEALKREKEHRRYPAYGGLMLPGETIEE